MPPHYWHIRAQIRSTAPPLGLRYMTITHGVPLPAGCMLYLGTKPFLRPKLNSGDLKSFEGLLVPMLFNLHYQLQLSGIHLFALSPFVSEDKTFPAFKGFNVQPARGTHIVRRLRTDYGVVQSSVTWLATAKAEENKAAEAAVQKVSMARQNLTYQAFRARDEKPAVQC